ncbi:MAG: hypothetical protein ACM3SP_19990 [Chloroflexota bacterium]
MLDFNRTNFSEQPINQTINELIERAEPPSENYRQYLGASSIGSECLRKVQFDWMCDPVFPARIKDVFARGHFFEEVTRQHLIAAGFEFAPKERLKFTAVDGLFCGHADGIVTAGPEAGGLLYPALWEHKCLNAKGWKAIERDGLVKLYAVYAGQVAVYQAYLNVTNPALFSVVNADTCERLHFLVPFDAQLAQAMSDRAVAVIEATRAGELLSRITENPEDWRCKMCSHRERCWRC